MSVTIDLPKEFEDALRGRWGDLAQAAKEALVIESYRTGRIGLGAVAKMLGQPTRIAAQEWLARRHVPLDYDAADLDADRATLDKLFDVQL